MYVSVTQDKEGKPAPPQSKLSLSTFKSFFQRKKDLPPTDRQKYCVIVGGDIFVEDAPTSNYCTLAWKVRNEASVAWPAGLQLSLLFSNPLALINN